MIRTCSTSRPTKTILRRRTYLRARMTSCSSLVSSANKKTGRTNRICALFITKRETSGCFKGRIPGGCEWLFTKEHADCIAISHNFQGYDGYFVQNYLHENGIVPEVIMRGAKVLTLNVPFFDSKFIDSLNFIPMRLADFPQTFGLSELAKGYFPHFFYKKENEHYVGPIPPSSYYNPNGMRYES